LKSPVRQPDILAKETMKSVIRTSNAIITFNNKLLLLLRDDKPSIPNANSWSLIGGVVEKGESFIKAMKREMAEEINVVPKDTKYLGKMKSSDGRIHAIFLSKMTKEESERVLLGDEGQKVDFFTLKEIRNIKLAKEISKYLSLYGEYLEKTLFGGRRINPMKLGLKP